MNSHEIPSQRQLLIPLVETIKELGGRCAPADAYERLAEKLEVSPEARALRADSAGGPVKVYERNVRWSRQHAVLQGLVDDQVRNVWSLTERADDVLKNIRPGVVITIFETENGVALWGESEAAVGHIEDDFFNLILTSPPYPLLRQKEYANQHAAADHVEWLLKEAAGWKRILAADGSLMLNLGSAWEPGRAVQSLYQERLLLRLCDELGFFLAQRLFWYNPAKMPAPAEWVTVRRVRVTPAVENVFWLSKTPNPKANNRNVLRPYSDSMRALLKRGGEAGATRPSGYILQPGAFSADNGGAIPHDLITASNTGSSGAYQKWCRERALPIHPARFPTSLAEFAVLLTTDEGDRCFDPFGGSLSFGEVCEKHRRRWISCDKSLTYLRGGVGRFQGAVRSEHPFLQTDQRADLAGHAAS
jgi:site-specific DNA-methyltransferase (cytosine-N4-specific)